MSRGSTPSHGGLDPEDEGIGHATLWHPRNIQSGLGRIVWAAESYERAAGWVLPGGRRTADESEARHAAECIDRILRSAGMPFITTG